MHHKKIALILALVATVTAGVAVFVLTTGNASSKLPKGYCEASNNVMTLGSAPTKTAINDMNVAVVLIDLNDGAAAYFVTEENKPQENTFVKVPQVLGQDTKIWQDNILLRTTAINGESTELLLAKKCN